MVVGEACVGYDAIRSMSGQYASYWNAFSLQRNFGNGVLAAFCCVAFGRFLGQNCENMTVNSLHRIRSQIMYKGTSIKRFTRFTLLKDACLAPYFTSFKVIKPAMEAKHFLKNHVSYCKETSQEFLQLVESVIKLIK